MKKRSVSAVIICIFFILFAVYARAQIDPEQEYEFSENDPVSEIEQSEQPQSDEFSESNNVDVDYRAQSGSLIDDPSYYQIGINKPVFTTGFDGFYSIGMDNTQNKGQNSTALSQRLNFALRNAGNIPGLSVYGYGHYNSAIHEDDTYGTLYLGYIEYRSLQADTKVMLGRFDLVTNRFMTIDGVSVTQVLPWYFGVNLFYGMPRHKEVEVNGEEFRDVGDVSYGGKLFLSGVPSFQANIAYYKEAGDNADGRYSVYRETLGGGVLYYKTLSVEDNSSVTANGHIEHDVYNGGLARLSGKVTGQYSKAQGDVYVDYYDMRGDDYPQNREFVIRLLSTGIETRFGADFYLLATEWMDLYGGFTHIETTMRDERQNTGQIYTLGVDLFLDKYGVRAKLAGYDYESVVSDAVGVTGSIKWFMTMDMFIEVTGEAAWLRKSVNENNAHSVEGRYTLYLLNNLTASVYGQQGSNNRFVDDYRWGTAVRYEF